MVNIEELDPEPWIAILDQIGLPTDIKEIQPGSKDSFNGAVRVLEIELAESTATVTVSAANPMIALAPKPVETSQHSDQEKSKKSAKAAKPGKTGRKKK